MSRFLQVFYVFFSAAMLALAIPNELIKLGSPLAGFISLIPLYIAYSNLKSYKEAAAIFALHTFLVHVMTSFWLAFFKDLAALTLGASAVVTGIIGGFIGLLMYLHQKTFFPNRNIPTQVHIPFRLKYFGLPPSTHFTNG